MKRTKLTIVWAGILLLSVASAWAQDLDAQAILDKARGSWQGDSFHATLDLEIILGGQTKSHVLEVWAMGNDYALIRILEPEIDLGSGYLQIENELWYYAPSVGMSIKLPAIALAEAVFGAGPSLDDLSHSTLSDDYDVTAEQREAGYLLTLVPHPDAPVVYGKLELRITMDYAMEQIVYYDQREAVVRTATFSDPIEIEGQMFPTTIEIEDASGDRTVERIIDPEFNIEIDASFFTVERLEGSE